MIILFSVSFRIFGNINDNDSKKDWFTSFKKNGFYLTNNILSPFTTANFKNNLADYVFLILTDTEIGASINAGYFFDSFHAVEGRFSIGPNNKILLIYQFHTGYNFFPIDLVFSREKIRQKVEEKRNIEYEKHKWLQKSYKIFDPLTKGLYIGFFVKIMDIYYLKTGIHNFNFVPYFSLGYWFQIGRLIIDIRINQLFATVSWSSLKFSEPNAEIKGSPFPMISKVLPTISFNAGWRI
jgi:hypothetical protein